MRIHTSFFLLLSALLCGCSSDGFKSGRGDVGQFILQQAISHGGSPTTNALPSIAGSWRYSEDTNGVVIHLARDQYPAVEAFLRQSFGAPKIEPTQTSDGGMLGVYRLSEKGGGIQFGYDAKQTQIIVIRPMGTEEIFRGVVEAAKEMEKSK